MNKNKLAAGIAPVLRMLYSEQGKACCAYKADDVFLSEALHLKPDSDFVLEFKNYVRVHGNEPTVVSVESVGSFCLGESWQQANRVNGYDIKTGRLAGKISIITGSAQGFGKGIAMNMARGGAYVAIADMNLEGAEKCADEINAKYGQGTAFAVEVNVADEDSVERMIESVVLEYGGLDIFVNNAGILKAAGLEQMDKKSFELVTAVNYTAYFLCTKYASIPMKIQNGISKSYMMDIIEINSKSGLVGSNRNFAYAGSKFGGIGLTQSFALELVENNIKVNAICPGNFYEGPLWSDPEKGLFVQYLNAGKVTGAKTIEDVKAFYESKVPMRRGCTPDDVAKAIFYVVEQGYETGQAIPVTGGQQMLH